MSYLISLNNITRSYPMGETIYEALKGISFNIASGEMLAIMGESGSGKSTIMNILGLLDRPTSGVYYLNEREIASLNDDDLADLRNKMIGFVFQSFFLLPRLNVLQNVSLPLHYRGENSTVIRDKAIEMLTKVKMEKYLFHRPNELSGGQQQRVAIARALIGSPKLILADEPTGALDSQTSNEVMDLFSQLHEEEHTTIVVVTHDPLVGASCDRIIHVQDGLLMGEA